mgnify:FL=1
MTIGFVGLIVPCPTIFFMIFLIKFRITHRIFILKPRKSRLSAAFSWS